MVIKWTNIFPDASVSDQSSIVAFSPDGQTLVSLNYVNH
jgi:hypothetical protein